MNRKPTTSSRFRKHVDQFDIGKELVAAMSLFVWAAKMQGVPAAALTQALHAAMVKQVVAMEPSARGKSMSPRGRHAKLSHGVSAEIARLSRCRELLDLVGPETLSTGRTVFSNYKSLGMWLCSPAGWAKNMSPVELLGHRSGHKLVAEALRGLAHGNVL